MKTKKSLSEFARILPFYKRGDHQCVKNHRPFSLFPVFNKISERLICNAIFQHLLTTILFPLTNPVSKQMTPALN